MVEPAVISTDHELKHKMASRQAKDRNRHGCHPIGKVCQARPEKYHFHPGEQSGKSLL